MHFKEVADLKIKAEIQKIKNEIEKFVVWIFQHHEESSRSGSKVIHDGVWGTHRYEEFEISNALSKWNIEKTELFNENEIDILKKAANKFEDLVKAAYAL